MKLLRFRDGGEIFGSRKLFPSRFAFLLNIFSCPSDGKIRHDEKVKAHKLGDRILKVKLLVCTQTNRQGERQKRVLLTLSLPHSRHCALISFFMLLLRPACFCCCLRTFPSYNPFLIGRLRDEEKKTRELFGCLVLWWHWWEESSTKVFGLSGVAEIDLVKDTWRSLRKGGH